MVPRLCPCASLELPPNRDLSSKKVDRILNQLSSFIGPNSPLSDVKALFPWTKRVEVEVLEHLELNFSTNIPIGTPMHMSQ